MISHIGRSVSGQTTNLPESNEWSVALRSRFFVCEFRGNHDTKRLSSTVHDELNFPLGVLLDVNHGDFLFDNYLCTCLRLSFLSAT